MDELLKEKGLTDQEADTFTQYGVVVALAAAAAANHFPADKAANIIWRQGTGYIMHRLGISFDETVQFLVKCFVAFTEVLDEIGEAGSQAE